MEKSVAKSGLVKIPKKKRSLDLQSLYNSGNSEEGQNETKTSKECDPEDGKKKGRKNMKSLSLSTFKSEAKKSRKDCRNRVTMASGSSGRLTSGGESEAKKSTEDCGNSVTVRSGSSGKMTSGSKEFNDSYLTSLENENVLRIPKHPRSPVGPKKFKSDRVSKLSGLFNSVDQVVKINEKIKKAKDDSSPDDRLVNLVKNSADKVDSLKEKRETVVDEVKRRRNGGASSARHANQEDDLVIVNNVDTSSKKQQSNNRKRKDFAACGGGSGSKTKRAEPSAGRSVSGSVFIDLQDANDYDEENLEQNAARMLSSRFDPSCTGFPSNKESIVSWSTNGLSSVDYSARDLFSRESNSSTRLKSSSADPESVLLRPKKDHKGKNISRKRRHFYEILPKGLDAYWVLKRKIKVFWPLDKEWYLGVVDNYDPVRKLHCVKYDDGVEEWIDLQKEKFKLLLLRSEVSGKEKPEISSTGDKSVHKRKTDLLIDDESCVDNIGDSEPIISWLARSGRAKALPNPLKKQKTMQMLLPMVSPISSDNTDNANKDAGFSERDRSKLEYDSGMPDSSVVGGRLDDSLVAASSSFQNRLYIRRRSDEEGERFLLWSIHDEGKLRLSVSAVGSKRFRYEICLSAVPFLEYSIGTWDLWLSHSVLIRQHGVIVTTSPAVILEMLFVDNIIGLRFFLFEGCLKQAVDFVSLILTVFNQPTEQWNDDVELPVTSISFRVSSVRDLRKRHVFEFFSFSKLKNSEWLYLDSKLLRHCLLIKQLPVSECTYSNIKALECGSFQLSKPCVGLEFFSVEGLKKKYVSGVPSMGVCRESCNLRMGQSIFRQAAKHGRLHPFALSFGAAPTFFLSLHLKMLIEHNFACINLRDYDTLCSLGNPEDATQQIVEDHMQVESHSVNIEDVHAECNFESVVTEAPSYGLLSSDTVSASNVAYKLQDLQNDKPTSSEVTVCSKDLVRNKTVVNSLSPNFESNEQVPEQCFVSPLPCTSNSITCTSSNPSCDSSFGSVEIPSFEQVDMPYNGRRHISRETSDLGWSMSDGFVHSPIPTGPRSFSHRGINSSSSSPFGNLLPVCSDGKTKSMHNDFSYGLKKPRNQVQYARPFGGYVAKHKTNNQRTLPSRRIDSEKRVSDRPRSSRRNLELRACGANLLVTVEDKGWRESGAQIVLELADSNEWRLAVKLSGITRYSYKVQHNLQPGSTNRYTHAMMWKGGTDWLLEFSNRSQWIIFKELHEECHNRNIRASSVKSIPIPGVRLIEESDDCATEVPVVQNSSKYFHQVQTDVEMAMNPSHIFYDMDSEDEQWLVSNKKSSCTDENSFEEISEEMFEKIMDMYEKFSYVKHHSHFTFDEIEDLMVGIGSMEVAKVIYEHWRQKRERKGTPLMRQLQPPLWESYQKELKEWELAVARGHNAVLVGNPEKASPPEKPPMFAFCLKPRGLDVPKKCSKQRSKRKFSISGYNRAVSSGNLDGLPAFGRRSNGVAFGDDKVVFPRNVAESFDALSSPQTSTSVLSPREADRLGLFSLSNDMFEWDLRPKIYKKETKKIHSLSSFNNKQMIASHHQISLRNRNGLPEGSNQKHQYFEGPHKLGVELLDASGAAQHARDMAKLKRDKAHRLHYRAELAIHKAAVALLTADAVKAVAENSNGDG